MSRGDSATRLLRVMTHLEKNPEGLTVTEIHSRLEEDGISCSKRTVYRDLDVISRAHFPLYNEGGEGEDVSKWKFRRTTAVAQKVHFENHEIFALYLARESLKAMKGSPLIDSILRMTEKLEKIMGPAVEREFENLGQYVSFKAQPTWQTGVSQEILDTVYMACWDQMVLEIDYNAKSGASANITKKRRVGPESLYFAEGGAYLIARDLDDQVVKTYSLARISSATYTSTEYVSLGFDLEKYLGSSFGVLSSGTAQDVIIEIQDPIASYVSERRWHDSQSIVRGENGIQLRMHVRINEELARWVLGLGPSATVKAPEELKSMVVGLATAIASNHKSAKAA